MDLSFVTGNWATEELDLWRISPGGGQPERLTQHDSDVTYLTPIDSRTVLYLAPGEDGSGPWLWAYDVERGRWAASASAWRSTSR